MEWGLATLGLTLLLVAGVSKRLSTTPLTPAMVVVAVGVLVGPLLLEQGADRYTYEDARAPLGAARCQAPDTVDGRGARLLATGARVRSWRWNAHSPRQARDGYPTNASSSSR